MNIPAAGNGTGDSIDITLLQKSMQRFFLLSWGRCFTFVLIYFNLLLQQNLIVLEK